MIRIAFCVAALMVAPALALADWPQFRGPGGSGIADDQKPPVQFGPDKNLAWKVPVPPGASSPIVVADRIFFTAFENGKLMTLCYSEQDGKELWRVIAPAEKIEAFHQTEGSPAASTPASDGKRVVVYFGSCGLLCYDLDGKEQWKFQLPVAETNFGFGTGVSPIISDGTVILNRDLRSGSALYALDLASGSQKWKTERPTGTSYGTPIIWDVDGQKTLVVAGSNSLTNYDLATGKELWRVGKLPAVNCTIPVVSHDTLIYVAWAPGGADAKMPTFDDILKQAGEEKLGYLTKEGSEKTMMKGFFDANDLNKDGKITADEWETTIKALKNGENRAVAIKSKSQGDVIWSYTKNLPYVPSALAYRDRVYFVKDGPLLTCLDARTGKPIYEAARFKGGIRYYASPVAANGSIYLCSLDGTIAVITAGEDEPVVAYSVKLEEGIRATPAIVNNTLYVRSDKFLYAFHEKK